MISGSLGASCYRFSVRARRGSGFSIGRILLPWAAMSRRRGTFELAGRSYQVVVGKPAIDGLRYTVYASKEGGTFPNSLRIRR